MTRLVSRNILCSTLLLAFIFTCTDLLARPDFDVHPRDIEHRLGGWVPVRDNMDIDNFGGDEVLEWSLEIIPEGGEWPDGVQWLTVDQDEGEINPDREDRIRVSHDDDDLEDGHYYADIVFTTNDPTRETFTVPVAAHTADYPQISTSWEDRWGGWWGIDMNNMFGAIAWGDTLSFQLRVRNRGDAELEVEDIRSNNAYWEMDTTEFDLDPDGSILVRFTFIAVDVGPNSTTITSLSNAWDPRELDFRIIGGVDPTFKLGIAIPDTVMDEDGGNILIADLDTVIISSDRGIEFEVQAENISWEISRAHVLTIAPDQNWYGITEVIVSSTQEDSVLADTFFVTVRPMPDAPLSFDLLAPSDGDTIRWDAINDSMFVWQASADVDGDTLNYSVLFIGADTTIAINVFGDTTASYAILDQILNLDEGGMFRWTVRASDDTLSQDAWSIFTNYAVPTEVRHQDRPLPVTESLVDIYPNPFNNSTTISINLRQSGNIILGIYDQLGREVALLDDRFKARGRYVYHWQPKNLVSGTYILKLEIDNNIQVYQIGLVK